MTVPDTTIEAPQVQEVPPPGVAEGMERFFGVVNGYMAFLGLAVGQRTGLLAAVLDAPGTAADVAGRAGTHERSTREWLCAMSAAGFLRHDAGTFRMDEGQAALFQGEVLPFDPTVLLEFHDVMARVLPDVVHSVRHGTGVPYAAYQPEFSQAQDALNAPLYEQFLTDDWVGSVDGLAERLTAGIDVADIGCGGGRALCLLAAAFPASRFVGFDIDDAALALGRERARDRGLDHVRFEHRDIAELGLEASLDLVLAVDAVHDQARPADVLAAVRRALRPDGLLVMVEPTATGDTAVDVQHPMATMGYMVSLGHCMQVSLAEGGPGLGSMWGSAGAHALLDEVGLTVVGQHESVSDHTVFTATPSRR